MKLAELTAYLDDCLQIKRYQDRSNNGLQVQGPEQVARVAFAVDACLAAFQHAVSREAQLLIVHHGLFWSNPIPITGAHYARVRTLMEGGCGLYGCHVPLDAHPEVGNNMALARLAGLENLQAWGEYQGSLIGWIGELPAPIPTAELYERMCAQIGSGSRLQAGSSGLSRRVAVMSGYGVDFAQQAVDAGADTLLTGETSHTWFHPVAECDLSVLYGGHYNTEKLGLQALARHLEVRFAVETVFIDLPTDL